MTTTLPPAADPRAQHPHPQPREYEETLRTWTWSWWRGLVGALTLLAGVAIVMPILLMPVLAVAVALEHPADYGQAFADAANLKTVTPSAMLYVNLSLAGATLVAWFVVRVVHNLRPRWLASVKPRIRWRFLLVCLGCAIVAMAAQLVLGAFLPGDPNDTAGHPHHLTGRLVALAIVIAVTTPLQAIGEEYAFRGYLTQAVGSLTGSFVDRWGVRRAGGTLVVRCVAIVLPATLFALAHGVQNGPLFLDRFLFGLLAGYLAVRCGGLEAGIALHVLNNLVAFGFALVFSDIDSTLTVTEASWWQLPLSLTQCAVYLVLVVPVARRMQLQRRTAPPVLETPVPNR